jgi:hypothetical protein
VLFRRQVGKRDEGARALIKALTKRARDQTMQAMAVKYRSDKKRQRTGR